MSEFVDIAIGQLLPIFISWLKRSTWPDALKVVLSLIVCVVIGTIKAAVLHRLDVGDFSAEAVAKTAGIIFTSATVAYKTWMQDTWLNARLERKQVL